MGDELGGDLPRLQNRRRGRCRLRGIPVGRGPFLRTTVGNATSCGAPAGGPSSSGNARPVLPPPVPDASTPLGPVRCSMRPKLYGLPPEPYQRTRRNRPGALQPALGHRHFFFAVDVLLPFKSFSPPAAPSAGRHRQRRLNLASADRSPNTSAKSGPRGLLNPGNHRRRSHRAAVHPAEIVLRSACSRFFLGASATCRRAARF